MSRIPQAFRRLKKNNEAALVPSLTIGYPSLQTTRTLLPVIARQGADMIELEVPLDNPPGGGASSLRAALDKNVTLSDCLSVAAEARRSNEVPLLMDIGYGVIEEYGLHKFAEAASASGIDGLVVPDLPPEHEDELKTACEEHNIDLIFSLDTTSTEDRIRRVSEMASSFIYVSHNEGAETFIELNRNLPDLVARIRPYTDLPLVARLGLGTPQQVAEAVKVADGVVVDRALTRLIETLPEDDLIIGVSDFIRGMKEVTLELPAVGE
jgi:tryptophan synthase alpha chain